MTGLKAGLLKRFPAPMFDFGGKNVHIEWNILTKILHITKLNIMTMWESLP